MRAFPPLPIRKDWTPVYLSSRGDANRDFAFGFTDAQGAPGRDGRRYHSAVDWFAPGGTVIRAPAAGCVVRSVPSRGTRGQVFGGVLEIEEATGLCWVMRHVDPRVPLGRDVPAGGEVASVTAWEDGGPHLHLELWRSRAGGYAHENMLDPKGVEWTAQAAQAQPAPAVYWFEELPAARGGRGPDVVGTYDRALYARRAAALRRERGELVSTLAGADGLSYVLRWLAGAYGERFRWGPWAEGDGRDAVRRERQRNTGRTMRPFRGRAASLYPWPMAA